MTRKTIYFNIVANNNYAERPYKVCWQIEKGVYKERKIGDLVY